MITYTQFVGKWANDPRMIDDLDAVIAAAVAAEREAIAKALPLTIQTAIEAEREACAKMIDERGESYREGVTIFTPRNVYEDHEKAARECNDIAAAIRARSAGK